MHSRMARLAMRKRERRRKLAVALQVFLVSALLVSASIILTYLLLLKPASRAEEPVELPQVRVYVASGIESRIQPLLIEFQREHPGIDFESVDRGFNAVVSEFPPVHAYSYRKEFLQIPPLVLKAGGFQTVLRQACGYWLCSEIEDERIECLTDFLEERLSAVFSVKTMNFVGDIIPGRNVARRMAEHGVLYPFEKVAPYICGADIVFANLECPLSDRFSPPYTGVNFIAPQRTIEGLEACGINILSLANNHSTNFGTQAFADTLCLLTAHSITYVGGGMNAQEAYAPRFMDIGGCRLAFLSYNAISGSINASEQRPGVAWFDMQPYAADDPEDLAAMQDAVVRAGMESDFMIVGFHWSHEYIQAPSSSQVNAAHAACEAGADMVIGGHPHIIQPIEYYKGSFIAYSMGNFVFDQMFAEYTREGFILRCKLQGGYLTEIDILPYKIFDYCQPVVLEQGSGDYLIKKLLQISDIPGS